MSFFNAPKTVSVEAIRIANTKCATSGSENPSGIGDANWSLHQETDGRWTVLCCGDVMYGPTSKRSAMMYYKNMTQK